MSCFPCFQKKEENSTEEVEDLPIAQPKDPPPSTPVNNNSAQDPVPDDDDKDIDAPESEETTVKSYTFRELATATKNFRQECLLGEGGFGRVYKGTLAQSGKIVAVRQLDRNGIQGNKDFVVEVSTLSFIDHPNLIKLIGYCADGDQRLLVYEYMPSGSLKNHLFDIPAGKKPLDWSTRMKIALGIAEGLEYLHEKADPPIIYRDLKSSNILLDDVNKPRLSEYGLANLVQGGNKMQPRVMAGYGYCAPEYERNGELTLKSDVYSFGVVLLELITGRRAMDTERPADEQNLVSWAQPIFRNPANFPDMADPLLRKEFPVTSLNQAVGVAAMCLQEEPSARPLISDISAALSFLAMAPPEAPIPARLVPMLSTRVDTTTNFGDNNESDKNPDCPKKEDSSSSDSEDDEDKKMHTHDDKPKHDQDEDKSSSDYEYGDSSDNSDHEDDKPNKKSIRKKSGESKKFGSSKKLSSSSKRKSKKKKKKSEKKHSRSSSRSSSSRSSLSSRECSDGLSLICDSALPEEPEESTHDEHDIIQQSHEYEHSSSSEEEEREEEEEQEEEPSHEDFDD